MIPESPIQAVAETWLLHTPDNILGVVDGFDDAERILRLHLCADKGWDEEALGDRLSFDLKFGMWVVFLDRLPQYGYFAAKIPKL